MSNPSWNDTVPAWEDTVEEQQSAPAVKTQSPSFMDSFTSAVKNVMTAPARLPPNLTPEKMSSYLPEAGVAIGSLGGVPGMAIGAGVGQIGKRIADIGYGRVDPADAMNPVSEAIVPMAQTAMAGAPIGKMIGKVLPGAKMGEMISGTTKQNLSRANKQGFWETYIKPKPLKESGAAFGEEKTKLAGELMSPEEQVAMAVNPKGEANQKVNDVMVKWLKKEPITPQEALAARQGTDVIFPADVGKKQVQRGMLGQFREEMNQLIAKEAPEFSKASKDYAASKLRSDLLKPARVNKSNPDQYSKLGGMMSGMGAVIGYGTGNLPLAIGATLGSSPLAMGLISSIAGSATKAYGIIPDPIKNAAYASFISRITTKENSQ